MSQDDLNSGNYDPKDPKDHDIPGPLPPLPAINTIQYLYDNIHAPIFGDNNPFVHGGTPIGKQRLPLSLEDFEECVISNQKELKNMSITTMERQYFKGDINDMDTKNILISLLFVRYQLKQTKAPSRKSGEDIEQLPELFKRNEPKLQARFSVLSAKTRKKFLAAYNVGLKIIDDNLQLLLAYTYFYNDIEFALFVLSLIKNSDINTHWSELYFSINSINIEK